MSIFKPVYLDHRIELAPSEFREAAEDIDTFLLDKIRKRLEGVCSTHGYVKPGSLKILARSMGQAEHGRFTGSFIYHCKLQIDCFLPYAEQVVDGKILKINKLGGYALIVEKGETLEAMRVLLPRDLHMGNAEFDTLEEGTNIRLRLLRSRFQANDPFIQGVGILERVHASGQPA